MEANLNPARAMTTYRISALPATEPGPRFRVVREERTPDGKVTITPVTVRFWHRPFAEAARGFCANSEPAALRVA